MELKNVVPWGRSFAEYQQMFCLSETDLDKSILGCGDGPASFNAELTARGGFVVSVDPTYSFSREQLEARIAEVYDEIMPQMEKTKDNYIWENIGSVQELGRIRMSAMQQFLADYAKGKEDGRYIEAALPVLPFKNEQFDIEVCSHYLFLYSEQVDLRLHVASVMELARVAKEVRIYPLITLNGIASPHLQPVVAHLSAEGFKAELVDSQFQFQRGAEKMLVVRAGGS